MQDVVHPFFLYYFQTVVIQNTEDKEQSKRHKTKKATKGVANALKAEKLKTRLKANFEKLNQQRSLETS